MKIKLVTVGKLKEKYLVDGIKEYVKRLNAYCKVEMIEVSDEPIPDKASEHTEDIIINHLDAAENQYKQKLKEINLGEITNYVHQNTI